MKLLVSYLRSFEAMCCVGIGKVGIGYLPRQPVEILDPPPLSKYTGIASFPLGGTPIFKGKLKLTPDQGPYPKAADP